MSTEIIEKSVLYQLWRSQALAEGQAKGETEGQREALILVLQQQVGAIPPDVLGAIVAADSDKLRAALVPAAAGSLEQVRAALGL